MREALERLNRWRRNGILALFRSAAEERETRIPRWVKVMFVALAFVGVALRFFAPCGCLGLTFWRPSVLRVRQIPTGCAIFRTPSRWIQYTGAQKADGPQFDPHWQDIVRFPSGAPDFGRDALNPP